MLKTCRARLLPADSSAQGLWQSALNLLTTNKDWNFLQLYVASPFPVILGNWTGFRPTAQDIRTLDYSACKTHGLQDLKSSPFTTPHVELLLSLLPKIGPSLIWFERKKYRLLPLLQFSGYCRLLS